MSEPLFPDAEWHHVDGSLVFGNLALANDGEAHIVVCKSRKEFDAFLAREGITAQSIIWEQSP